MAKAIVTLAASLSYSSNALSLNEIKSSLHVLAEVQDPTCARLAQNYAMMMAPPSGHGLIKTPQNAPQSKSQASDPANLVKSAPMTQGTPFAQAYRAAYDKCLATRG